MADDKSKDKKKDSGHHNGGEMPFFLEIVLFIVVIFIIWVLTGGTENKTDQKPFLETNPIDEIVPYVPTM